MGQDSSTQWLTAVFKSDITTMNKLQLYRCVDESRTSKRRGFCGIHYASYFGNEKSINYLKDKEAYLLTKYPVWINVYTYDNKSVLLPEGLSYQCILALQGQFDLLKQSLSIYDVIQSQVPLLSCVIIGKGYNQMKSWNHQLFRNILQSNSIYNNPLMLSALLGNHAYTQFILKNIRSISFENYDWMIEEAMKIIPDIRNNIIYKGLQHLVAPTLEFENSKYQIEQAKKGFIHADDNTGGYNYRNLSISDFVDTQINTSQETLLNSCVFSSNIGSQGMSD
ncbi:hypothetical protein SS50377_28065 [Spironucleus salmonicida]|uniref:Uncharacterized protein n=1 Tax=Spironucleus salmonicida TaxID=348837 RepID=V6LDQ4_9EUKA|nr:hypothetical protein SS50377_28065 [Spironucleus salmonicida]|eukprot:EST42617.1 Hypothetical protein SS50377_17937 [Spironucleus salmonicida]